MTLHSACRKCALYSFNQHRSILYMSQLSGMSVLLLLLYQCIRYIQNKKTHIEKHGLGVKFFSKILFPLTIQVKQSES